MLGHTAHVGHALAKRFIDGDGPKNIQFPSWAPAVVLADLIIFIPFFLVIGYTLGTIFPTLAIVEDPNPPAYEPLVLDDTAEGGSGTPAPGKPVTTSLRATRRLLAGVAGWRSYFRGIACAAVLGFAKSMLGEAFHKFLPIIPVGALLAQLSLTQLGTALTHIIITAPTERRFYQRLPPFKKTFEATCFPILVTWLATTVNIVIPALVGEALGLHIIGHPEDTDKPRPTGEDAWKVIVVVVLALILQLLIVVPTSVILIRVQASLLPPDEETIIPFDRSFGGKLEPVIVGGRGFITMRDAFSTIPVSSWIRIYKMYAKILGVVIASYGAIAAIIVPQVLVIMSKAKKD